MVPVGRACVLLGVALAGRVATAAPDLTGVSLGASTSRAGTSFAADASGIPSASYFKTDRLLYWYHYVGTAWVEEPVAGSVISNGARNYSQLVFVHDRPHVVFYDSVAEQLKHAARNVDGTWSVETIDAAGHVGAHLSATACARGNLCAAYYDSDNTDLKFAIGTIGSWTVSTLDASANDVGQFTHVALDVAGRPLVSYYDATLQLPKVAEEDGLGAWTTETLPAIAGYGRWTSIVQASDGTTRLAAGSYSDGYTDASDSTLYYAEKPNGGAWSASVLETLNVGASTNISLLPDERPQIATRHWLQSAVTGQASSVYYTWLDGTDHWQHVHLTPNDDFNNYNGITTLLDHWGNPLVAYYYSAPTASKLGLHGPADADGDFLPDYLEDQYGTSANDPDTDGDEVADGVEVLMLGTSPVLADTDGDGIPDGADRDPLDPSGLQLVRDGSCDRPLVDAWEPLGSPQRYTKDTTTVKQGLASLFVDAGGGGYAGVVQRSIATDPSTRYFLHLWYRRQSGTIRIRVGWAADDDFETLPFTDGASSGWQRHARYFTTPAGAGDLRILADTDGAAWIDGVELFATPAGTDLDGDGIADVADDCPAIADPGQADADGDGEGDACALDADGDGEPNGSDCAPADPTRWRTWAYLDADGDGVADSAAVQVVACHGESLPGYTHAVRPVDNCPEVANPSQLDTDGDGLGDACDPDADGDGVANGSDCAPLDPAAFQLTRYYADPDGDGVPNELVGTVGCIGLTAPAGYTLNASPADDCPDDFNPGQEDDDGDGIGNACDPTPNGTTTTTSAATSTSSTTTATSTTSTTLAGSPTKVLEAAFVSRARTAATRHIQGFLHWSGMAGTPIPRARVVLVCDGRRVAGARTSRKGLVRFTIPMKRGPRTCFLQAGDIQSGALTIPARGGPARMSAQISSSRTTP